MIGGFTSRYSFHLFSRDDTDILFPLVGSLIRVNPSFQKPFWALKMILIHTVHGIPNSLLGSEQTYHFSQRFFRVFQRHSMQVRAVASTGTSEFSKVAGPFKTTMAVAAKCTDSWGWGWGLLVELVQWLTRVGSLGTYWVFTRLKLKILKISMMIHCLNCLNCLNP